MEGWIVARVLEVPGAVSQGRTREEARENVLDALRTVLTPDEELAGKTPEAACRRMELGARTSCHQPAGQSVGATDHSARSNRASPACSYPPSRHRPLIWQFSSCA